VLPRQAQLSYTPALLSLQLYYSTNSLLDTYYMYAFDINISTGTHLASGINHFVASLATTWGLNLSENY